MSCFMWSFLYKYFILNPFIKLQSHMTNKHKLNENTANELKIWVNDQLPLIEKCESCDQFKKSDIINKMVHLVEAHRVIVLPKFIPTGLSRRLNNIFHRNRNTVDIPTSSSNQQPTCSTSNTDDENFNSNLNSLITVESTEEDNWTDSMHDIANIPEDIAPSADSEKTDSYYNSEVDKLFGCSREKNHSMSSNE